MRNNVVDHNPFVERESSGMLVQLACVHVCSHDVRLFVNIIARVGSLVSRKFVDAFTPQILRTPNETHI